MGWNGERNDTDDLLMRIVALLLALASLAEHAGSLPLPVRSAALWFLRPAEAVAWEFVTWQACPEIPYSHRRDERADRKRHPVIMTALVVFAAVGASLVTLAAVQGSFTGGGEVADQQLAAAASQAAPVIQDAASRTGDAARDAGSDLRDKSRDLLDNDAS